MKRVIFVAFLIGLLFLNLGSSEAQSPLRIGTFDLNRGGVGSLLSSSHSGIRSAILTQFPGSTLNGTSALTPAFLESIDLLWIASTYTTNNVPITPLSEPEKSALRDFVERGGRALIFIDNIGYSGANQSLLDPFGLTIGSTVWLAGAQTVSVQLPHTPVTNGTFGVVNNFTYWWPGWFGQMGPHAHCLATLNANGQCALAFVPPRKLAHCSGGVVLFTDVFTLDGAFSESERTLVLNAIAATAGSLWGDVNGDFCADDKDLTLVLRALGQTGSNLPEDLNCDERVNQEDLSIVISGFGHGC